MSHHLVKQDEWQSVTVMWLQRVQKALSLLQAEPMKSGRLQEVRVACRRAESALELCGDLIPTRSSKWLRKHMRQLRRTSNTVRDYDVIRKWLKDRKELASVELLKEFKKRHDDALSLFIRSIHSLTQNNQLADRVKRVCKTVAADEQREWVTQLGRRLLNELFDFWRAVVDMQIDTRGLHQLRIASKRLRYASEFLSEVIPNVSFRSLLGLLKQIQARLGEIQNTAVQKKHLNEIGHRDDSPWHRDSVNEQERLIEAWTSWWQTVPLDTAIGSAIVRMIHLTRGPSSEHTR